MKRILLVFLLVCQFASGSAFMPWVVHSKGPSASGGSSSPTPELLWVKMNDGTGGTAVAAVGPNITTGAAWDTPGANGSTGSSLNFNGSSHTGTSATTINYGGASTITVTFAINPDDITSTKVILESGPVVDSNALTWLIYFSGGSIYANINDSSTLNQQRSESCTAPSTGAWADIAVVFDVGTASGQIKIFINGVDQSTTLVSNFFVDTGAFSTQTLYVGARNASSLYYDGKIDDLRIYNREITGSEITQVKNDRQ